MDRSRNLEDGGSYVGPSSQSKNSICMCIPDLMHIQLTAALQTKNASELFVHIPESHLISELVSRPIFEFNQLLKLIHAHFS